MIVAEPKPIEEVAASVRPFQKIVLAGCGSCVSVCLAGGEKEALRLAGLLRLSAQAEGRELELTVLEHLRQCDAEFLEEHDEALQSADAILSLACGAGVQFLARRYPCIPVLPALNTTFLGASGGLGYWTEMCQGCGACLLEKTGGVCPVARCAKSHFNGPCGGNQNGLCEVGGGEIECAWQLIYERLSRLGQLDKLLELDDVRDWSTSRDGGPRSHRREDVMVHQGEE